MIPLCFLPYLKECEITIGFFFTLVRYLWFVPWPVHILTLNCAPTIVFCTPALNNIDEQSKVNNIVDELCFNWQIALNTEINRNGMYTSHSRFIHYMVASCSVLTAKHVLGSPSPAMFAGLCTWTILVKKWWLLRRHLKPEGKKQKRRT